jgi:long-chain acyl-CoA synthetase
MPAIDIISNKQAENLFRLFRERVKRSPNQPAYKNFDSKTKQWKTVTWSQAADNVAKWQAALVKEELKAGDRVAINLRNCVDWVYFDQAAMSLGLVVVPLYPDDRPDSIAYILEDAGVKLVLLQHIKQWHKLQSALSQHCPQRVLIQKSDDTKLNEPAIYVDDWLTDNAELQDQSSDGHELASIIYTSGTTGRPKGVMLSHQNMLSVAFFGLQYINIFPEDVFLSFLPLSHTLERTAGYYLPMMSGSTVAYARGIPQLADDMLQVQPSVLIAVPRIFERIYNRLYSQLNNKPPIARKLFDLTKRVGLHRFDYQQNRSKWQPLLLVWPLLEKLVASKVQARLGGNMRVIISGGAALPQTVAELFTGLGFCILQGYGLTETSPVISVNEVEHNYLNSVGKPLPSIKVKIGDNNELLVKGPGNMMGYWNNEEATSQVINDDGWLHTGDQARISVSGHIYINGRIKDILVMSNGEKVPPADIESAILMDDRFEQVLVIGESESFLSALIVLNADTWPDLAKEHNLAMDDKESLSDKSLHNAILQRLKELLHDFPAYAKIRKVALYLDPWSIENDLMTPTMKVKRAKVISHHQDDIDLIYEKD